MNYLCYLFLSHLPYVEEEVRFIDGKEQPCLIIPTESNQIKRGKQGKWLMIVQLRACKANAKMITHDVGLMYLKDNCLKSDKASGRYDKTMRMGRVYVHDCSPWKKIDRTNRSTPLICDGMLVLSDIPKELIFTNSDNARKYVSNLTFHSVSDTNTIFTGSVCIDDIPLRYIKTDRQTGKRWVRTKFCKLDKLDTYMNTHKLVIVTDNGGEIEIGRFKEWVKDGVQKIALPDEQEHLTTVNPRVVPKSIDGIKF